MQHGVEGSMKTMTMHLAGRVCTFTQVSVSTRDIRERPRLPEVLLDYQCRKQGPTDSRHQRENSDPTLLLHERDVQAKHGNDQADLLFRAHGRRTAQQEQTVLAAIGEEE